MLLWTSTCVSGFYLGLVFRGRRISRGIGRTGREAAGLGACPPPPPPPPRISLILWGRFWWRLDTKRLYTTVTLKLDEITTSHWHVVLENGFWTSRSGNWIINACLQLHREELLATIVCIVRALACDHMHVWVCVYAHVREFVPQKWPGTRC